MQRLVLATLISASGFALTIFWYHSTAQKDFGRGNTKPIARLVTLVDEVQRKPVKKLIWQPATENETLYAGEAIRTGTNAEAAIEFLASKTRIDLEADSAIVLEETANRQLAVNFLSGNMYVKSGTAEEKDGLTLKSGEKSIALKGAEVSWGKDDSNDLNLQVLKGTAQGEALARTPQTSLKVVPAPLLPGPLFVESVPQTVEATNTGFAKLEWQKVNGADQYLLLLKNPDGATVKEVRFREING